MKQKYSILLIFEKNVILLLIIAVSIVVKGEFANKTVNYDTKTKVKVLI